MGVYGLHPKMPASCLPWLRKRAWRTPRLCLTERRPRARQTSPVPARGNTRPNKARRTPRSCEKVESRRGSSLIGGSSAHLHAEVGLAFSWRRRQAITQRLLASGSCPAIDAPLAHLAPLAGGGFTGHRRYQCCSIGDRLSCSPLWLKSGALSHEVG